MKTAPLVLLLIASLFAAGAPRWRESLVSAAELTPTETSRHWAFQPIRDPPPPGVRDPRWQGSSIDRFIAARHEQQGVAPVASADRRTLIRRLHFDLIGMPPSRKAVEAWMGTTRPLADLVDELLARPEFGERWGRHWLDVARYADSNGCSIEANNTYDDAWRYRDYVITSFNRDKPFDQFTREQIAGDLLEAVSDVQRCEQIVATGFLQLGPKAFGTSGFERFRLDVIDEQIDSVGKAFVGLSLGCARCHDHKFEPFTTADYYALAGVFSSTRSVLPDKTWRSSKTWHRVRLPILDPAAAEVLEARHEERIASAKSGDAKKEAEEALAAAKASLAELENRPAGEKPTADALDTARRRIADQERAVRNAGRLAKVLPQLKPFPVAMAVEDGPVVNEAVRRGGVYDDRGDVVPRAVPVGLGGDPQSRRFEVPEAASGRAELANWIVDPVEGAGGLLARVNVNRIWNHLIGAPLVATVDNFGTSGSAPSHPLLLEHLAHRFVAGNWSVKSMIRQIVLSQTYQLSAADAADASRVDPGNRYRWRHHPRRLDAEAFRDALLVIGGNLDPARGGKTLQHAGLITISSDHIDLDTPSPYLRRTVYLPVVRDALGVSDDVDESMALLATFDFATPNLVCGSRERTVVPRQALFLMNDRFLIEQSRRIADRLLADAALRTDAERLEQLYFETIGRPPRTGETERLLIYLDRFDSSGTAQAGGGPPRAWASLCQAVLATNEFLFVR